jgi:hypothetical protein
MKSNKWNEMTLISEKSCDEYGFQVRIVSDEPETSSSIEVGDFPVGHSRMKRIENVQTRHPFGVSKQETERRDLSENPAEVVTINF